MPLSCGNPSQLVTVPASRTALCVVNQAVVVPLH